MVGGTLPHCLELTTETNNFLIKHKNLNIAHSWGGGKSVVLNEDLLVLADVILGTDNYVFCCCCFWCVCVCVCVCVYVCFGGSCQPA